MRIWTRTKVGDLFLIRPKRLGIRTNPAFLFLKTLRPGTNHTLLFLTTPNNLNPRTEPDFLFLEMPDRGKAGAELGNPLPKWQKETKRERNWGIHSRNGEKTENGSKNEGFAPEMAERDKTGAELGNPLPVRGSVGRDGAQGRRVPRTALGRESQRGSHSPQGRTGRGIIPREGRSHARVPDAPREGRSAAGGTQHRGRDAAPREGHSAAGGTQRRGGTGRAAGGTQRRGAATRGCDEGAATRGLRRGGRDEGVRGGACG